MIRPLVWAAAAYVMGEAAAAFAFPSYAAALLPMIWFGFVWFIDPECGLAEKNRFVCAGRRQISTIWSRYLYVLPAFFLLGFSLFLYAAHPAGEGLCREGSILVSFEGKVDSVEDKGERTAIRIPSAKLMTEDEDTVDEDLIHEECPEVHINNRKEVRTGVLIYVKKEELGEEIREGYRIQGRGKLSEPKAPTSPGQFDMRTWYLSQGVSYILMPSSCRVCSRRISWRTLLHELRRRIWKVFSQLFTEKEAGILDAMLLGDRLLLDDEVTDLFRMMGISHILAISGLHISLVGWGLYGLVRKLGMLPEPASLLCAFMVLSYGVLTGMSASTMRAVVMFLTAMGAEYFGRSYDMLCGLSLAALVLFIHQPLLITQSGVQFSFSAVLSLGILWPAMRRLLPEELLNKPLIQSAGSCGAACLATLPLTAISYGEIPLLAIPVNLIVLPMISLLVPLAALTGIIGLTSLAAAAFTGGSVHTLLWICMNLCRTGRQCPLAVWRTGHPPVWVLCLYYLVLAVFVVMANLHEKEKAIVDRRVLEIQESAEKREVQCKVRALKAQNMHVSRVACLGWGMLLFALLILMIPWQRFGEFAWFLDVGQGDCAVLRSRNSVWMFDGGSSDTDQVGEFRLVPFLDYYGEEKVDYAFVSHGDADHYSGIQELMEIDRVGHLAVGEASRYDPGIKKLIGLAHSRDIPVVYLKAGDTWQDGNWCFSCLYPRPREEQHADTNDRSLVIRADCSSVSFLFTGDISSDVETELLGRHPAGQMLEEIDILKCPHHGSRFSSCRIFLHTVQPGITIISCGEGNRYGHPAQETLERLKQSGSSIYCTKEGGSIRIKWNRDIISAEYFRQ